MVWSLLALELPLMLTCSSTSNSLVSVLVYGDTELYISGVVRGGDKLELLWFPSAVCFAHLWSPRQSQRFRKSLNNSTVVKRSQRLSLKRWLSDVKWKANILNPFPRVKKKTTRTELLWQRSCHSDRQGMEWDFIKGPNHQIIILEGYHWPHLSLIIHSYKDSSVSWTSGPVMWAVSLYPQKRLSW